MYYFEDPCGELVYIFQSGKPQTKITQYIDLPLKSENGDRTCCFAWNMQLSDQFPSLWYTLIRMCTSKKVLSVLEYQLTQNFAVSEE